MLNFMSTGAAKADCSVDVSVEPMFVLNLLSIVADPPQAQMADGHGSRVGAGHLYAKI
jgi:hypothetical protein